MERRSWIVLVFLDAESGAEDEVGGDAVLGLADASSAVVVVNPCDRSMETNYRWSKASRSRSMLGPWFWCRGFHASCYGLNEDAHAIERWRKWAAIPECSGFGN